MRVNYKKSVHSEVAYKDKQKLRSPIFLFYSKYMFMGIAAT